MKMALCALLLLVTAVAYLPSLDNQLTNWDDVNYIDRNPHIGSLSAANIGRMFTTFYTANYHPLTMLSYAIDHAIGGLEASTYHRTALVLHLLNTLLVFLLADRILCRSMPALLVALLFGVHPLHVESVAWVSGRKDLLFAPFFFASMLFYLRYCREGSQRRGRMYGLALLCFVLSLLSKGQAVSLAPSLVALDYLKGRRLLERRVLLEKLPFFALAIGFGIVAVIAQRQSGGQLVGEFVWGMGERFVFACYGYVQYLILLIAPHSLSAFYPYPHHATEGLPIAFLVRVPAVFALAGVFFWAIRRVPILAFSIAFFTVNIVFVLQLLPIGDAIMADRYSYVSSIGFFLALAAGVDALIRAWPRRRAAIAAVLLAYTATLSVITYQRCDVWQDSATLWDDVLAQYPEASAGLLNRALLRYQSGDLDGAERDLSDMIRLWPLDSKAYGHRAVIRFERGDSEGAIADMTDAIALEPSAGFYVNRGSMRVATDDLQGAISDFTRALAIDPGHIRAYSKRARTKDAIGDHRGALDDYRAVVSLAPSRAEGHFGVAGAYQRLGDLELALESLERAIALDPSYPAAYLRRGQVLMGLGERRAACEDLARAVKLDAQFSDTALARQCGG